MSEVDEDRFIALRCLHAGMLGRFPALKLDDVISACDAWSVDPIRVGEWIVGALLIRADEIHVGVEHMARGHWLTRAWLRTHVAPVLAQHGALRTSVERTYRAGHEFVTRIGFEVVQQDAAATHYMLRKLRHA